MKIISFLIKTLTVILWYSSYLFPASTFFIQKRFRITAFCFFSFFIIFSIPAWLRLWSYPAGLLISALLAIFTWIFFLIKNPIKQHSTPSITGLIFRFCICIFFYFVFVIFAITQSKWIWGYQLFHIPTPSMTPTLVPGDYVLADTWTKSIQKTDVVVFKKYQHSYTVFNVKRVGYAEGDKFHEKILRSDQVAVIGDNLDNSEDSRIFGAINRSDIVGKVVLIVFSYENKAGFRIGRFGLSINGF